MPWKRHLRVHPQMIQGASICPRCGQLMIVVHSSFQCPKCKFKVGCCEGPTGEDDEQLLRTAP